jgi:dipeptidyl-peptidase-4
LNKVVSKLNINSGKTTLISYPEGNNSASFSKSFNYFINTNSTAGTPYRYVLKDASGKEIKNFRITMSCFPNSKKITS